MEILLIAEYVCSSFAFQNWRNNNRMGFWDPFSQALNKPEQTSTDHRTSISPYPGGGPHCDILGLLELESIQSQKSLIISLSLTHCHPGQCLEVPLGEGWEKDREGNSLIV